MNLGWIFRPDRADGGADHAGKQVHSVGRTLDTDGRIEVTLTDGARVRAYRREIVPG
ncbi:hypothetical protein [Polymorphospora rubra]|uniref:hypothetical protein n=1 Tax=Polymorphospora rubra TaxID=338584 RepID=UPI001FEBA6ED|nr:hypothetical protein [Polymorphospora rubra]